MKNFLLKFIIITILFLVFPVVSFAQVVINEIMYDPEGTDANAGGEWIEIKITENNINLSTWKIADKTGTSGSFTNRVIKYERGPSELISGDYVIIAKNAEDFSSFFPSYSGSLFSSSISLTEDDEIKLLNENLKEIDNLSFSSSMGAKGDGNSLQKTSSGWVAASPTPGAVNNTASNTSDSNDSDSIGEVLGTSSDQSTSSNSSSGDSTTNVSSLNSQLEIIAGNNRITSPGSPIWFQAIVKKNTTKASPELNWSFGDGNVGVGSLVSHTYKYAGDYVVVLSARVGEVFSVSRLKVKVINSNIEVLDKGQYLEILNKSNTEINLFNWKIEDDGKGFIFQPNTIILSNSSVKFDKSLLKLKGYDNNIGLSLKNYLGEEIFSAVPIKEVNLEEVSLQINKIQKEAYSLVNKAITANLVVENPPIPKETPLSFSEEVKSDFIEPAEPILEISSSSIENIIYQAPKKEGMISKLTKFIKKVLFK